LDLLNQGRGHIFGLRQSAILTPKLATNVILGYYTDENNLQMFDTYNYNFNARLHYHLRRLSLRGDLHYYPRTWLRIKTGAELSSHRDDVTARVNWRTFVQVPDSIDYASRSAKVGAYWQGRIKPGDWLEFSAGLRYDYSTLFNQAVWNPRGKLILSPSPLFSFWLSSGLYSQFPDVMTLIGRGEPLDITRNPSMLNAENSLHNIIGLQWNPWPHSEVKVELYRKVFDDLLLSVNEENYIPDNIGQGAAQGIELSLERTRQGDDRFGLWFYYTLASAKYRKRGTTDYTYFDYDQRHRLNAGIDLRLSRNWSLTFSGQYGTGFPYTPIRAMQRDMAANNGFFSGWRMVRDDKNSGRYPDYQRLDVRLSYATSVGRHRLSAYIEIINLLNHANVYLYEWDIHARNGGRGIAYRSVIYMMPLLPSFGLQWSF
ncbi:TonB-dependent receptor, partial [candidate division KSB1 bacterium]|nr:TonB-dependent receptor [candidate division KSB1 bacterium]